MPTATHDVILLDLDGTLTDSAPGILACLRYALDAMDVPHPDDATMRTFLGPPLAVTFGERLGMTDAEVTRAIAAYRERYHDVGLFENEVYEGVPALLEPLGGAGAMLASPRRSRPTRPRASSSTSGSTSTSPSSAAPSSTAARHAQGRRHRARALHLQLDGAMTVRSPIVMVGDREHDVSARPAARDRASACCGATATADELIRAGAVRLCASPADLLLAALTR